MVRLAPIAERMYAFIARDENWRRHFRSLLAQSPIINAKEIDSAILKLEKACKWHANNAKYCRRQSLQTRFFETGDNFYLGMELPREYQKWKTKLVDHLLSQPILDSVENDALRVAIQHTLQHHIDR